MATQNEWLKDIFDKTHTELPLANFTDILE